MTNWPECYYQEENAQKRKSILLQAMESEPEDAANDLRMKLWEMRYLINGKQPDKQVDNFVGAWIDFIYLAKNCTSIIMGRHAKKELQKTRKKMGMDLAENEIQVREVLYEEYRHLGRFYFKLCATDKNYGTKFMGMISLKDEDITYKIAHEVEQVAYFLPFKAKAQEDMRIFTEAVTQGFYDVFPNEREKLDGLIAIYQ